MDSAVSMLVPYEVWSLMSSAVTYDSCYVSPTCKIYGTLCFRAIDGHHAEGDKSGIQFT